MNLLKFEINKIFRNRFLLITVLLLLILNCFNIWKNYSIRGDYNIEVYTYRSQFYKKLKGDLTAEKVKWLTERNEYAAKALISAQSERDQFVTGDANVDVNISNEFIDEITRLYNYNDEIKTMKEDNEKQKEFAAEHSSLFLERCAEKIDKVYSQRQITELYRYSELEEYFDYSFSSLFIIIVLILAFSPLFASEHESGMYLCFMASTAGRKRTSIAKLLAMTLFTFMVALFFSAADLFMFTACLKLDGFSAPIYALASYKYTPLICSLGTYTILLFFIRLLGFLTVAALFSFLSSVIKNSYGAFLASLGATFILMAFEVYGKGNFELISSFNPIKLIVGTEIISSFSVVNVFGFPVFSLEITVISCFACFVLICLVVLKVNNKNQRRARND